jgi:hypothetical protein
VSGGIVESGFGGGASAADAAFLNTSLMESVSLNII